MKTVDSNTDSFDSGAISIGNTAQRSAAARVQRDIDSIGWLGANLQVIGMTDLRRFSETGKRRVPDRLTIYEKPLDGHECRMPNSRRAQTIDMNIERRHCVVSRFVAAELLMSYRRDEDGRIVVDESAGNTYWGVMRHAEAIRDGLLVGPEAHPADLRKPSCAESNVRDPYLLVLHDRTSGLTIPLPDRSLLLYRFWDSGMSVDLYVVDEISLRIQKRSHPECFDADSDERLIQREIDECEAELAYVIGNNINLRRNPNAYSKAQRKETQQ